jgi:NAD(P)-dependent dehydrogenase (short-subunit alcohol dehydrogenase family)
MSPTAGTGAPKVVLVTGASGGVGRGIAIACGQAGWTVWIAARREAQAAEVAAEVDAAGGRGRAVVCDVADPASVHDTVSAVVASAGRLDGVVHNATSGLSPRPTDLTDVPLAEVADHVAVSLRGTYLLAVASHAHLKLTGGAYVVLTSEAGFEGKARLPVYAAVKGAQRGVVRSLAREWGPDGIRVNGLAPLASTPAMEQAFANDPAMSARVLGRNPTGRLGDAVDDIGPVVRFLLSDEARYVNGLTVMADGGACPIT